MACERTDLHPAERNRRRAVAAVRGATRGWPAARRPSLDDVRDAVGDVLAAAVAGGWAERPGAWWYLKLRALRTLRGWQRVRGGKVYSARGGATAAATEALALRRDGESTLVGPDEWISERLVAPEVEDPHGLGDLELLRWAGWSDRALSRELGVSQPTVSAWRAGRAPPQEHVGRLSAMADALRWRFAEDMSGRT